MARTQKQIIKSTEEWLNDRWDIMNMENPPRPADKAYYNGAVKAVEMLGYDWTRDKDGKHRLFK